LEDNQTKQKQTKQKQMETAEQTAPIQEGVDLLEHLDNIDLTSVDRSFPVIKEGTYAFELTKFETKKNKAKTGTNLIVHTKTLQEVETEDGRKLNAGFPIQTNVSLVPTDKYNPATTLADIQLCLLGEQRKGFKLSDYVGRKGVFKLKVEESTEYGRQHRVARWVKLAPVGGAGGLGTL
jgi:hypothetical protein